MPSVRMNPSFLEQLPLEATENWKKPGPGKSQMDVTSTGKGGGAEIRHPRAYGAPQSIHKLEQGV